MKEDGVVVVMSSNLASIANNTDGGWEVYRASKASLNTLLRSYAARNSDDRKTYLALSPGWVRTDMGGPSAPLDVETSVTGMLSVIDKRRGNGGVAFVDDSNEAIRGKIVKRTAKALRAFTWLAVWTSGCSAAGTGTGRRL